MEPSTAGASKRRSSASGELDRASDEAAGSSVPHAATAREAATANADVQVRIAADRTVTDCAGAVGTGYVHRSVSTRRLIIAALLCGLAILVAFSVQLLLVL
jgi:hypothetical protein